METGTELGGFEKLVAAFQSKTGNWNDSPDERASTRHAVKATFGEILRLIEKAAETDDVEELAAASSAGLAFAVTALPLLIDQIALLEERIEALEEER